ncbi:MAG: hypothetical protein JW889_01745 [Verrucomicrobia bacterium]|nr:hypothetical protein [Verrucomicrobiota bacterium]
MDRLVSCASELFGVTATEAPGTAKMLERSAAIAARHGSTDFRYYARSTLVVDERLFFLARLRAGKVLVRVTRRDFDRTTPPDIDTTIAAVAGDTELTGLVCPCTNANAAHLQHEVNHLRPRTNPGRAAFGAGDRVGLSTPGHVRALRSTGYFPLFAQQSIREMDRTGRLPEDVMATAVWGLVEEGFTGEWGADADHLKTAADIERVSPFGYTMFTLDPSAFIQNPDALSADRLRTAYAGLPWTTLHSSPKALIAEYAGSKQAFTDRHGAHSAELVFGESSVVKCAVKYSAGIAHCATLASLLRGRDGDRDVEVSFDETDWPTSPLEHLFIASEFRRLGMQVDSLALRFPGAFEKGIDYRGDLAEFEATFAIHAAIRDAFDMYRLSIHSGSDKFTVYPIMSKYAGDKLHVKTAGTTYLEALRVAARQDPAFFREVLEFSYERYAEDKRTYHVSADPARMPTPKCILPEQYPKLLEDDAWRQVLHVAFGSVLTSEPKHNFRSRLCDMLAVNEEAFYVAVERHFDKHLGALGVPGKGNY